MWCLCSAILLGTIDDALWQMIPLIDGIEEITLERTGRVSQVFQILSYKIVDLIVELGERAVSIDAVIVTRSETHGPPSLNYCCAGCPAL